MPVRQWVVSVPKRLRGFLADRPEAVTALAWIVLDEIRRLLVVGAAASGPQGSPQRRTTALGAVSFLHRFGPVLKRHVHLHACVTDGVFTGAPDSVSLLSAHPSRQPISRPSPSVSVGGWSAGSVAAAADMLAFENSGISIDGSVRIALVNRDVPSFYRSLEYLMRSCARPASALGRLSLEPGRDGGPDRIRYTLPRHKRGQWLGPGRRRRASAPDTEDVIRLSPLEFLDRLADVIPPPHRHRHRYHCVFAPNHPLRPACTALAIGKLGKLGKRGDAASQHESSLPLHRGEGRGEGAFDARPCSHDTARIA